MEELIKELMNVTEFHREYQDKDIHYVIDANREGDTLTIKVKTIEDTVKKEFEAWANTIPDDIFQEAYVNLSEKMDIAKLYESKDYKKVISTFKKEVGRIVNDRITSYKSLL